MTNSGEPILHSGRTDDRHHEGVAIILSKAAAYHPVIEGIQSF